jgi:hypothetical protein
MGNRWGANGEQMGREGDEKISLRATWEQGGRILLQQGGFQVSKRGQEREQRGSARGDKKARGKRQYILRLIVYIMIVYKCWNDCQLYVCK